MTDFGIRFRSWAFWSTDQHLRVEDSELFLHGDTSKAPALRNATEDVNRDLRARGVYGEILDQRLQASISVTITSTMAIDIGRQTIFSESELTAGQYGAKQYIAVSDTTVPANIPTEITLVACDFGTVYNEVYGLEITTTAFPDALISPAKLVVEGCDSILTRATTYKALALVYLNYSREPDDCFLKKMQVYTQFYRDEIDRLIMSGLLIDNDGDEKPDGGLMFPAFRLERG